MSDNRTLQSDFLQLRFHEMNIAISKTHHTWSIIMKKLVLCDNGEYQKVAPLCEEYHLGVEVQAFYDPEFLVSNPEALEIQKHQYGDTKIQSMHGPFADLCFGSFDRLIREATKSRFEYAYAIAEKLECEDIVLHHGYVPGTSHYQNWIKRGKAFWTEFLLDKGDNITFHLENMLELDPELISDIVSAIDDPRLNICLDVGHAFCNSKTDVLKWIVRLNKQIGYVHLHNNLGSKDEHLGFEKGAMLFDEICHALDQFSPDSIWAIETNTEDIEPSIQWLQMNCFLKSR